MKKQVVFTTFGANSAFGSFEPGQKMHVESGLADHLVDVAMVAKHVGKAEAAKVVAEPAKVAAKTAKKK
jgi:hypothetical protein